MEFFDLSNDYKFKEAEYAEGTDWEGIICPVNEGHQRAGKRMGDLRIEIHEKKTGDFLWTALSECIISDRTANLFQDAGFTGFKLKPVQVCNKSVYPVFWEFIVTGKGGDVRAINNIELKYECDHCKHVHYSSFGQGLIIDEKQWDGSDFFTVWPLPRFILITERVKDFIIANKLTNVKIKPVEDLIGKGKEGGLSPGNYDAWINNTW